VQEVIALALGNAQLVYGALMLAIRRARAGRHAAAAASCCGNAACAVLAAPPHGRDRRPPTA